MEKLSSLSARPLAALLLRLSYRGGIKLSFLQQALESEFLAERIEKWVHGELTATVDPDPVNREAITDEVRTYWEAIRPHAVGGAYINFVMEEGADCIRATYGDTYERLREVKAKYDPENLFRVNQNVRPVALA